MKTERILLLVVLIAVVAPLTILIVIPPWRSRVPCIVQQKLGKWTGVYFHHFPADYSGSFRMWDEFGNLTCENGYKDGQRHGQWIKYDAAGRKTSISEYRNGEPWDGVCYIFDMKSWTGEYRHGRPWNGCLPLNQMDRSDWRYFVEGQEVTEVVYKARNQIPDNSRCIGLSSYALPEESKPMRTSESSQ